ncbi:MAG: MFS transporter [Enterococcaceae bacterium]|jgi:OFA family oxalate/formate antiporter-like MFS transporter|nr:MFS transporter [Enterococcaceae bacterium]MCI1918690.1 MFS transporter [Enterococcaceae bacterium]
MKFNRWVYASIGVIILLFSGLVYAWSVIAIPIKAYFSNWTNAQLSLTFTLCMIFFCISGVFSGLLSHKISPQKKLLSAAVLFLVGFWISSQAESLPALYLGYGVLAGTASGVAYNTTISTVTALFPDKPGIISGILLMGFGLGSFLIGKIYQRFTLPGAGFRRSLLIFGIVLFIVIALSSFLLPKETIQKNQLQAGKNTEKGFTPQQMLRTKTFWYYFVWATLLSGAGLILISQAANIAAQVSAGISAGLLSTIVGLISIANGAGRVFFGYLFDQVGQERTIRIIELIFAVGILFLMITLRSHHDSLMIASFIFGGFAYGGITPTNAAFIESAFGRRSFPINFSLINLNLVISSFSSTFSGKLADATGSYFLILVCMAGMVLIGSFFGQGVKKRAAAVDMSPQANEYKG